MTVIIDTSPLISFAIINQLGLLEKLFPTIIVPQAVSEEIAREKSREENVRVSDFIKNRVSYPKEQNKLKAKLGKGETEAINLCIELEVELLIIDDKKAKNAAESLNIKCIGTLGVLTLAKKKGLIKELRTYFKKLIENKRYFSIELLNRILHLNQEKPLE